MVPGWSLEILTFQSFGGFLQWQSISPAKELISFKMDHLSPEAKHFLDQGIVIIQLKPEWKFGPHTLLISYETIEIIFPVKAEFSHFY